MDALTNDLTVVQYPDKQFDEEIRGNIYKRLLYPLSLSELESSVIKFQNSGTLNFVNMFYFLNPYNCL